MNLRDLVRAERGIVRGGGINGDAAWLSPKALKRQRTRRNRVAPGPLRPVSRRHSVSWLASFAMFAGGVVGVAVIVANLSGRTSAEGASDEEAAARRASVMHAAERRTASPSGPILAQARPVAATAEPSAMTAAAPEPARTAAAGADPSPFRLDQLPVLASRDIEPDTGALLDPTPKRRGAKAAPRRTASATRSRRTKTASAP